jgi:hypothetical protein
MSSSRVGPDVGPEGWNGHCYTLLMIGLPFTGNGLAHGGAWGLRSHPARQ